MRTTTRYVFVCYECRQVFEQKVESHDRYLGRGEGPFICEGTLRYTAVK